jgi:hypothetical protein
MKNVPGTPVNEEIRRLSGELFTKNRMLTQANTREAILKARIKEIEKERDFLRSILTKEGRGV